MKQLYKVFVTALLFSNTTFATVTNLTGFYRSGQVFLTWTNIGDTTAFYKVYRSHNPITASSQLANCEYLGLTTAKSALDNNLTQHDGLYRYVHLDSGSAALTSGTGLFVATTLVTGNYYYAVTTLVNNVENKTIVTGANSLASFISESVAAIQAVFQETRLVNNKNIEVYTLFTSMKFDPLQPPIIKAGFLPFDFLIFRNNATGNNPLKIYLHGGGTDFFEDITDIYSNEVNLNPEDSYPDFNISNVWWGSNPAFDVFNNANNSTAPTSGTNYNYSQLRLNAIVSWAIKHLPIDSNRIYLKSTSVGSPGAYFYCITYPQRIAAAEIHNGTFSYTCDSDWQTNCSLNSGMVNRVKLDDRLGTLATDLSCNLGIGTYEAMDGGWVVHQYPERDLPFIYSINGKNDSKMGWTEKTIYYDSVNHNHPGGYYFWDDRDHSATFGQTWGQANFDLFRYKRNSSYPAFANCSLNEDFGNGNGNSGATYGTINGTLDWNDLITDVATQWQIKIFVRNLLDDFNNVITYPDSATADVTPRRLQQFHPTAGNTITWSVTHHQQIIQSGSFVYNGGIIVIPAVKIFKDTSVLSILQTTSGLTFFYQDLDQDGYGNAAVFVQASTQPDGYVTDSTDCNDNNGAIHPNAADVCNGIDDNCNGTTDEKAISATITPAGTVNICAGGSITLHANSGPNISYQWKKGNNNIAGATNQTYAATKTGGYKVTESNNFNCSSVSATTTVNVVSNPSANITPLGNLDICSTGSVVLQANGGSGLSYQWERGSTNISGATNQNYTAISVGTYRVIVANSTGCSKTSAGAKVTKSCKEENALTGVNTWELSIFPNPTADQFMIGLSSNHETDEIATIEIVDMMGQILYTEKVLVTNGGLKKEISFDRNVADGIYFVKVVMDDQVLLKQIAYQKQ